MNMKKVVVFSVFLMGLSGVFLWAQQRRQVAVLTNEVGTGESILIVEWVSPASVGMPIMVEDRDGEATATGIVRHIHERHIILKERLGSGFPAGSRVYQ
mgnify:CR=1 FL=1